VEGGSAHYFSDIQHWTAFFFIAYYGSLLIQNIEHKILLRLTYGVCILMIFLGAVNCLYSFKMLAKDNYITKQGVLGKEIRHVNLVSTAEMIDNRALFFTQALKMALVQNENFHKLKAIAALDNLPRKKERILYIEDEQWLTEYLQCYKYPFLLTGTTGISLLNGFSLNDCYWGGYGVEYYRDIRSFPAGQDLCDLVASPMFEEIISYNINKESYTIITCKK
jgi:hypothetical protein